jgi:ABC-type Fe3+-hydroxamate transport system substrate-binding protein
MAKLFSRALVALLFTLPAFLYAAPRVVTLSPANTELAFAAGITPLASAATQTTRQKPKILKRSQHGKV